MRHAEQDALAGGLYERCLPGDRQIISRDLDEVVGLLQRKVGPHSYTPLSTTHFLTKIQFRKLSVLRLSYGWFAPALEIISTPIKPYYSLFFRRSGSSEYRAGRDSFVTSPWTGAFLPGMRPLRVRTMENWHVFGTQFSPESFQAELSKLLGRTVVRPIEFDPKVNFEFGAGRIVRRILNRLYGEAARMESESAMFSLGVRHLERLLITVIVEGFRHNYSKFVNGPERGIAPWQVRTVEDFILEHANEPLTLGELALVGGVTGRSLQYTFRRHKGVSPMEFLRRVRLERVRNDLMQATDDTTVTSVAMRWGFLHLGRFAAEYQTNFGETPSATLRRERWRID